MRRLLAISAICIGFVFYGCACAQERVQEDTQESIQESIQVSEQQCAQGKSVSNPFFYENTLSVEYCARFLELGIEDVSVELLIEKIASYENGVLYKIVIDANEEVWAVYGKDMLEIGCFFVQKDKIILLKEDLDSIEKMSEEDIERIGTVICQENEKKDSLAETELGWHERILVEGNRREYRGYSNLVETGYYEHFVWEQGTGLVSYRSGFGAESYGIELQLVR